MIDLSFMPLSNPLLKLSKQVAATIYCGSEFHNLIIHCVNEDWQSISLGGTQVSSVTTETERKCSIHFLLPYGCFCLEDSKSLPRKHMILTGYHIYCTLCIVWCMRTLRRWNLAHSFLVYACCMFCLKTAPLPKSQSGAYLPINPQWNFLPGI